MRKNIWYTHSMDYYLAIKINEIIPFAATQMNNKIIILTEDRQRQMYHLNDTNELIYNT